MTDDDKWIYVDPRTGKLIIRFRVRGFSKQFYISSGLKKNKTNLDIVRNRIELIQRDIALNRFDETLESYKFGNHKQAQKKTIVSLSLRDVWDEFVLFQSQHLEKSTIESTYRQVTLIINELPTQSLDEAAIIREFLLNKYSYHTAYKTLAAFSRCFKWATDSKLLTTDPFEKIQLPKPKKRSDQDTSAAYTLNQRDLIIEAFENHARFSHHSSIIKFLFWTGCRPGEAFALTWADISNDCCKISITKSYASRVRLLKGTKNGKRRVFTCQKESKLRSLLLKLKPHFPNPSDLVFKNQSGQRMTLKVLSNVWRGNQVNGRIYKGLVTELAEKGIIPYLKLYSTRHTFATWAIASGASPEKVAYWIGDNVQTVLTYYCHPDVTKTECPDF
jgi:integrase